MEIHLVAVYNILGNTGEGDRQFVEVDGVMISYGQLAEQVSQVLSLYQPSYGLCFGSLDR